MKAIDIGTGYERGRQLPGADLCSGNIADDTDPDEGCECFWQFAMSSEPLPVADGTYDLVWYSYGLYSCDFEDRQSIADEITRITKPRATLVLRDYTQWYEGGVHKNIPFKEWMDNLRKIFPGDGFGRGWSIDTVSVLVNSRGEKVEVEDIDEGAFHVTCILKKGWG